MVAALEAGDLGTAGALLDASHASLRDDYDASVPAVERAVEALKAAGATGARMVGGGFGGAVLGLLGPGARAPDGALAVAPADGAPRAEPPLSRGPGCAKSPSPARVIVPGARR